MDNQKLQRGKKKMYFGERGKKKMHLIWGVVTQSSIWCAFLAKDVQCRKELGKISNLGKIKNHLHLSIYLIR